MVQFDPSAVSSSRSRLPVAGSREHLSADQVSVLTGSQFALGPPSALLSSSSQSQSQSRSRSVLQLPSPLSRLDEVAAAASASNSPSKRRRFGANGVQLGGDSAAEHAADMEREQLLQQQQQLMRQHMHMHDHFAQRPAEKRELRVLDCDSVSQVKRKICSALYEHEAFSSRPHPDAHELGKCSLLVSHLRMCKFILQHSTLTSTCTYAQFVNEKWLVSVADGKVTDI